MMIRRCVSKTNSLPLSRVGMLSSSSSLFHTSSSQYCAPSFPSSTKHTMMHYTSLGLAGLVPLALVAPASIALPVDLGLSVIIPTHMLYGLSSLVEDYVPTAAQFPASALLYVMTATTVAGLVGISNTEKGLTGTVLTLWQRPAPKE